LNRINEEWVVDLNKALADSIRDRCENKKLLLTLTGGMDTRTILSILLNLGYSFDSFTYRSSKPEVSYFVDKDVKIAEKLSRIYGFNPVFHFGDSNWGDDGLKYLRRDCDVVLGGGAMSEFFNMFEYNKSSMYEIKKDKLDKRIRSINENDIFAPVLDPRVLDVVKHIPICYRMFGIIQREIIRLNEPDLLNVSYAEKSVMREMESRLYRFLIYHRWFI